MPLNANAISSQVDTLVDDIISTIGRAKTLDDLSIATKKAKLLEELQGCFNPSEIGEIEEEDKIEISDNDAKNLLKKFNTARILLDKVYSNKLLSLTLGATITPRA